MTRPYKKDGQATIFPACKGDKNWDPDFVEKLIEYTGYDADEPPEWRDEPWLGGFSPGTFEIEEVYVDTKDGEKSLHVSGGIGPVHLSIYIPIKDNEAMRGIVEEMGEHLGVEYSGSGLFLAPEDFEEVRRKTADGQGRINLGMGKAGKDVRVVVLEVE